MRPPGQGNPRQFSFSGSGAVSPQLGKFVADFESKILRPVREKRAANDEILTIQRVALGVREIGSRKPKILTIAPAEKTATIHSVSQRK